MERISNEKAKEFIPISEDLFNSPPVYFTVQKGQDEWEEITYYTSKKRSTLNMYQQIVDMELQELEQKLIDTQNELISGSLILDEIWKYHPANSNFVNPIKVYDELKKSIEKLELKISDLELKIKHLKSTN